MLTVVQDTQSLKSSRIYRGQFKNIQYPKWNALVVEIMLTKEFKM